MENRKYRFEELPISLTSGFLSEAKYIAVIVGNRNFLQVFFLFIAASGGFP